MYEGNRRGNQSQGTGPDRSHARHFDRGGAPPRARGRGRGGNNNAGGGYYGGGGYGQNGNSANYDSATPESYNQWNNPQDSYYGQNTGSTGNSGYANGFNPYNDAPGGYNESYGSYEGAQVLNC